MVKARNPFVGRSSLGEDYFNVRRKEFLAYSSPELIIGNDSNFPQRVYQHNDAT
jgi:hypothetical protein